MMKGILNFWKRKMKQILVLISALLAGCTNPDVYFNDYENQPRFDWKPQPLQWERNVRDCRSQAQCDAANLFRRT